MWSDNWIKLGCSEVTETHRTGLTYAGRGPFVSVEKYYLYFIVYDPGGSSHQYCSFQGVDIEFIASSWTTAEMFVYLGSQCRKSRGLLPFKLEESA